MDAAIEWARQGFKDWITRYIPVAAERATYMMTSGIVTMAAVYFGSGKFHKLVAPVMLVLACGCKIFALLAVPFILNRRDQ